MAEQEQISNDWREKILDPKPPLKIADGEEVTCMLLDEGVRKSHPEYGESIMFSIKHEKEEKLFYVSANNFNLLRQIKELGALKGTTVKISRKGSKKTDTRYTIEKVDEKE